MVPVPFAAEGQVKVLWAASCSPGGGCVTFSITFSFLSGREERLRKEEEEQKRRKLEIAEKQARKMKAFLEEKEKEVLQLQVRAAGASWEAGCQNSLPGSHVGAVGLFSTDFSVGSWEHEHQHLPGVLTARGWERA